MSNNVDSSKRLPVADRTAARQVASSNLTTNHFLGACQRPWMKPSAVDASRYQVPRAQSTLDPRSKSTTTRSRDAVRPLVPTPSGLMPPSTDTPASSSPGRLTSTDSGHVSVPDVPSTQAYRFSTTPNPALADDASAARVDDTQAPAVAGQELSDQLTQSRSHRPPATPTQQSHLAHYSQPDHDTIPHRDMAPMLTADRAARVRSLLDQYQPEDEATEARASPMTSVGNADTALTTTSPSVAHDHGKSPYVPARKTNLPADSRTIAPAGHTLAYQLPTPTASPNLFTQRLPQKRPIDKSTTQQSGSRPPLQSPHGHSNHLPFTNRTHSPSTMAHFGPPFQSPTLPRSRQMRQHQPGVPPVAAPPHPHYAVPQHDRRISVRGPVATYLSTPSTLSTSTMTVGRSYLAHFEATLQSLKPQIDLSAQAQHLRIPWIRDACQQNDLFFLLLNQLFCLRSLDRAHAARLGLGPSCDPGFAVLELLFGPNSNIPNEFVAFLAGWPNSPYSMAASHELSQWISGIVQFLPRLGLAWERFRQMSLSRRFPPCEREIEVHLNCPPTSILPRAIFSSIQRQIGSNVTVALNSAAFSLFTQNQKDHFIMLAPIRDQGGMAHLPPLEHAVKWFAGQYFDLVAQHCQSAGNSNGPVRSASQSRPSVPMTSTPIRGTANSLIPNQTMQAICQAVAAPIHDLNGSQQPTFQPGDLSTLLGTPFLPPLVRLPAFLINPVPHMEALHQVHLQHPVTVLADKKLGSEARMHQFTESCVLAPHALTATASFATLRFELSQELVAKKADIVQPSPGSFALPSRLIETDSMLFNLRCTFLDSTRVPDEAIWTASQTYWPRHIFITMNGTLLEIRRKRQHRRDLPIDVTPFVRAGENVVKVSIHPESSEKDQTFGIGVDAMCVRDPEQVSALLTKVSPEDSLRIITQTMQPSTDNPEDDDMQIVSDSMTISITDPFSSTIFKQPVRGRNCRHHECFDFGNFLDSRPKERDGEDLLTTAYSWLCPICNKDARPSHLVLDGFLQHVRDKLVAENNENARAIIVNADGSWTVKPEIDDENENGGGRSPGKEQKAERQPLEARAVDAVAAANGAMENVSRVIEIIDIDDIDDD